MKTEEILERHLELLRDRNPVQRTRLLQIVRERREIILRYAGETQTLLHDPRTPEERRLLEERLSHLEEELPKTERLLETWEEDIRILNKEEGLDKWIGENPTEGEVFLSCLRRLSSRLLSFLFRTERDYYPRGGYSLEDSLSRVEALLEGRKL
jgi:hypothetical protein